MSLLWQGQQEDQLEHGEHPQITGRRVFPAKANWKTPQTSPCSLRCGLLYLELALAGDWGWSFVDTSGATSLQCTGVTAGPVRVWGCMALLPLRWCLDVLRDHLGPLASGTRPVKPRSRWDPKQSQGIPSPSPCSRVPHLPMHSPMSCGTSSASDSPCSSPRTPPCQCPPGPSGMGKNLLTRVHAQ